MCGITGFWDPGGIGPDARAVLARMTDAIRHRGPDDCGQWFDEPTGFALGHRRLSILDLSPEGHQPMASASGRFVMAFNGEFYNWRELRKEEEDHGARWRGHSDTEVFLARVERRGFQCAVESVSGMFAIALWDCAERALWLARDRLGEKPLYYGWAGASLVFGSELKALRRHPAWVGGIDRDALAQFLRFAYIPAPRTIFQGIRKLRPGTMLRIPAGAAPHGPAEMVYWSAIDAAERGQRAVIADEDEARRLLEAKLRQVVGREMVADVPLGALLSGGVDSSLIVALMQTQSAHPVRSFSIGFHERAYDEAPHAAAVARHLGTEHTELYVTPEQALAIVPRLPAMFDEPFADSSQIPTFLVAELARRHVTVSLSGDGGDELFGGYVRYRIAATLARAIRWIPAGLRVPFAQWVHSRTPEAWDRALAWLPGRHGNSRFARITGDRILRAAEMLGHPSVARLYRGMMSNWPCPEELILGGAEPPSQLDDEALWSGQEAPVSHMMLMDSLTYLPDDILARVDRASMAVGLEARAPFLDHSVFELAWRLPQHARTGRGAEKRILRQLLARYVPSALVDRPKMGFGVPLGSWLRGPLREWADSLLASERLTAAGILDPRPIRRKWDEHQRGAGNWQYPLWVILMFEAWRDYPG